MPSLTGASPRAEIMNGDATCNAPIAAPAFKMVRREMDFEDASLPIAAPPQWIGVFLRDFAIVL
jgi:hypothetical protein